MVPTPAGHVQIGTTTVEELRLAGRTWRNTGQVTALEADESFTWRTTDGADAPHLRQEPLPGVPAKPVLLQFAKGDQTSPNPAMTAFLDASGLSDHATLYRNDLAFAEDHRVPKNPHGFLNNPTSPIPPVSAVSRGAQHQMAVFFASHGNDILQPEPRRLFEVPINTPLPETLNFIP